MIDREPIMQALLAKVTGEPCIVNFAADLTHDSAALVHATNTANLLVGMPLSGPGIAEGAVIATLSPPAMSLPATATMSAAALTQGFVTTGRRLQHWTQIAAQPALFVDDGDEEWGRRPNGIPAAPIIEADIWIYAQGGANPDAVPATVLNALLGAVEAALAPTPVFTGIAVQNVQTLGGIVEHCWIEGRLLKASGHLEGQARAVVPVRMLVPQ